MSAVKLFSISGLVSGLFTILLVAPGAAAQTAQAAIGMTSCWLEADRPNENESMIEGTQAALQLVSKASDRKTYKATYKSAQFQYEVQVELRDRLKLSPRVTTFMQDQATGLKSTSDSFVQIDPSTSTQPHGSVLPRLTYSMSVPEREIRLICY